LVMLLRRLDTRWAFRRYAHSLSSSFYNPFFFCGLCVKFTDSQSKSFATSSLHPTASSTSLLLRDSMNQSLSHANYVSIRPAPNLRDSSARTNPSHSRSLTAGDPNTNFQDLMLDSSKYAA
jgi:hypothetical protein